MARINLTSNNHHQENLGALASLGVLMCMVVTVVGIKLWWFKHRLSFDENGAKNGVGGGNSPAVIVPRRSRRERFKKDKRYSQQIYDNGELHGVFHKKKEDDYEIKRPEQLPPVRVRQRADSTASFLPPATCPNRSEKVHSTAFEDLEVAPATMTAASSLDLTETHTKISLTFEEFEKQFKLKELKAESSKPYVFNDISEVPVPPLRLNRSSSAMVKPEKAPRYLKSSQSIALPEYQKIIERRPNGFSQPSNDLTKLDEYESFGDRRPTGYIKYEIVDGDVQQHYKKELDVSEKELNIKAQLAYINWEGLQNQSALDALRNERVTYTNNINESPESPLTKIYQFNINCFNLNDLKDIDYKEEDFKERPLNAIEYPDPAELKTAEIKEISSVELEDVDEEFEVDNSCNMPFNEPEIVEDSPQDDCGCNAKFETVEEVVKEPRSLVEEDLIGETQTREEQWPTYLIEDQYNIEENDKYITELYLRSAQRETEIRSVIECTPTECALGIQSQEQEFITEYLSVQERRPTEFVKEPHTEEEELITEYLSVKDRRPTEYVREPRAEEEEFVNEFVTDRNENLVAAELPCMKDSSRSDGELLSETHHVEEQKPSDFVERSQKIEEETEPEFPSVKERAKIFGPIFQCINGRRPGPQNIEESSSNESIGQSQVQNVKGGKGCSCNRFDSDSDNQSSSWPQFEEKIETPEVNKRKIGQHELETQTSSDETEETPNNNQSSISFNVCEGEDEDKFTLNQRRPTAYVRDSPEYQEIGGYAEEPEVSQSPKHIYGQSRSIITSETPTVSYREEREVKFESTAKDNSDRNDFEDSAIKQRRPTGFVRHDQYYVTFNDENEDGTMRHTGYVTNNIEEVLPSKVTFEESGFSTWSESETEKFTLNQRRPTGFVRPEEPNIHVRFDEYIEFKDEHSHGNTAIQQRRPTGFVKRLDMLKLSDEIDGENKDITNEPIFSCQEMAQNLNDSENDKDSETKQRRPTGFARKDKMFVVENQDNPEENVSVYYENEVLDNDGYEQLQQRRPTGFVKKNEELKCLQNPAPIYQPPTEDQSNDFDDPLWREMERDVALDFPQNVEEEFTKIRDCYELNEADFLEKSPLNSPEQPLGFGKSIEDDWHNFEKLKPQVPNQLLQSPEIKITFNDEDFTAVTTSILKESRMEEYIEGKPRKSKVTFDFKTNEFLIPSRRNHQDLEYGSFYDEDVYDKSPPPLPETPQPRQRCSNINYNNDIPLSPIVPKPISLSLFGSQMSREDDKIVEDSWSYIRQHRNLRAEFQNLPTSPPPLFSMTPPRPAYRNPMAQLAIQRAREVRADMDGFRSRSINNRKPEGSRRHREKCLNLNNNNYEGTDA